MADASTTVGTSATLTISDLLNPGGSPVFTRNIGPFPCDVTQIIMQEFLSVPPAGIIISLGQSFGVIYIRNVSAATIIVTFTIPGPIAQNWSVPGGGFILYAVPTPGNPTLGQ